MTVSSSQASGDIKILNIRVGENATVSLVGTLLELGELAGRIIAECVAATDRDSEDL